MFEGSVQIRRGSVPLLISVPHAGTRLTPAMQARLAHPQALSGCVANAKPLKGLFQSIQARK